jgi:ABC-type phosphate/phosphonate transport system substrate-binding protein
MKRIYLVLIVSVILQGSFLSSSCPSITGDPRLYFFNPDSAQSNLGRLKLVMETFFNQSGYPVSFQAFTYQTDFDSEINEQQPKFLFAPEWYIKKHERKLKIKPFLVPVYKGATTYHKVLLVAASSPITLDSGENHSLAMTSVGPQSRVFLNQVLFQNHFEKMCLFSPVIVPKSTDALFALFLGHVDSALVVQEHLGNLEKMLPRIIGGVRPLVLSKPIPMPMLCYSEKLVTQEEVEKFKTVFLGEKNKTIRDKLSELLEVDGWQETSK